jgi:hypothetical protein
MSLVLFFRAAGVRWADFWFGLRRFIWLNLPVLLLLWGLEHWMAGWALLGLAVFLGAVVLFLTAKELGKEGLR